MSTADPLSLFESRTLIDESESSGDGEFRYRLLTPSRIEPGKEYPLVLFLHGAGERGEDNAAQIKYLPTWLAEETRREQYPCFLLAPQCGADARWVETPRAFDRSIPRQPPGRQMRRVLQALEATIAEFPIDLSRLYLTGLSMGGFGSWDLGTRLGHQWAAVAPICGGGDELYADRLVGVPVWAWHGDADEIVPVEKSRRMVAAIRAAGGDPLYTELAGVGHDSWTPAYTSADGLLPWMFAQRKGTTRIGAD